jgi:hypothetical protein
MRTDIPPLLQYPIGDAAYAFTASLISMFYAPGWGGCARGLIGLLRSVMPSIGSRQKPKWQ